MFNLIMANAVATPEQGIEIFGISASQLITIFLVIAAIIWGYVQKNRADIVEALKGAISGHVKSDLLQKALDHLVESSFTAAEVTFREIGKKMKEQSADGKYTEAEKEELMIYAKQKLKSFIPATFRDVLKQNGQWGDEILEGQINKAVTILKRLHRNSKNNK